MENKLHIICIQWTIVVVSLQQWIKWQSFTESDRQRQIQSPPMRAPCQTTFSAAAVVAYHLIMCIGCAHTYTALSWTIKYLIRIIRIANESNRNRCWCANQESEFVSIFFTPSAPMALSMRPSIFNGLSNFTAQTRRLLEMVNSPPQFSSILLQIVRTPNEH